MPSPDLVAVTGAFSYSGRYITRRLLDAGKQVITLTNHPNRANPFGDAVRIAPLDFGDAAGLHRSLAGASTLFNTYWIRYPYGEMTHEKAVANSAALFDAAKKAGVRRVVHTSIANPTADSPLKYYVGKWNVEQALIGSGLGYAILRPAVLFGGENPAEDVLINNIAWILRRFPAFGLPGDGSYGIQPTHIDDYADFALEMAARTDDLIADACGLETFTFANLASLVRAAVGSRAFIMPMHPALALAAARVISLLVGDVLLTDEEVVGLMDGLLVSKQKAIGKVKLSAWLADNAHLMGQTYSNEVARHFK